jgi:hypothetical protein
MIANGDSSRLERLLIGRSWNLEVPRVQAAACSVDLLLGSNSCKYVVQITA